MIIAVTGVESCRNSSTVGESVGNLDFVLIEESSATGEKEIKLSELLDDYSVVVFENSDSAFFKAWKPVISENYIAIVQNNQKPIMLFDRKGNFVAQIGAVGNGPGEYLMPYDAFIDENRKAIYVTQFTSEPILEYNFAGQHTNTFPVKGLNKASITGVDDKYISIVSMAFADREDGVNAVRLNPATGAYEALRYPALSNTQIVDKSGKIVGYNNEIWAFKNTPNNTFMITTNDTLYAYDATTNSVVPRAYLKESIEKDSESWYVGMEFPGAIAYQVVGPKSRLIWKDKQTSEVSNATIINDFCGNATVSSGNFRNGYFIQIWEPGILADRIEERWCKNEMTEEQRHNMNELLESLDMEGNDVMFIGKMK